MFKDEINGTKLEIELEGNACVYKVGGELVAREDYLAVLASLRASALNDIAFRLGGDSDTGISSDLQQINESLDPSNDESFAAKFLKVLEAINLSMP
jgi:hypothetical protein